jgi:DNA-binding NarL/FixJ family response regulator
VTTDRHEAVELADQHRPEIAVLGLDWFAGSTVESLRASRPSMQFVMSTRCENTSLAARKLGAAAVIDLEASASQIIQAVRAAALQKSPPEMASSADLPLQFNPRERGVMQLLVTGATNQEIADELHLSLSSIKKYTSRIYRKLGVRNRGELVRRIDDQAQAERPGRTRKAA